MRWSSPPESSATRRAASARHRRRECVVHARENLVRPGADVLEPERDLRFDLPEDDLILRILEDRRHRARERRRMRAAGVATRDSTRPLNVPPWNHGTSPPSARTSVDLPEPDAPRTRTISPGSIRTRRRRAPAAIPGRRTSAPRRTLEPQRPHDDGECGGEERRPVERAPRRRRQPRPSRRAKPRASIASARLTPRSSDPASSGESSAACPRSPSGARPRPRSASTRPDASRSSVGTSRVASAAASTDRRPGRRRDQAVVVEQQRVHGEREPDGREAERSARRCAAPPSSRRAGRAPARRAAPAHVIPVCSSGDGGDTKPALNSVPHRYGRARRPARRQTASRISVSADRPELLRQQRRDGNAGKEGGCGGRPHGDVPYWNRSRGQVAREPRRRRRPEVEPTVERRRRRAAGSTHTPAACRR